MKTIKQLDENTPVNVVMLVGVALALLEHFTVLPEFAFVPENAAVWLLAIIAGIKVVLGVIKS